MSVNSLITYKLIHRCIGFLILFLLFYSSCSSAGDNYFKLAFASPTGANLWSLKAIQQMCAMDKRIVQTSPHLAYNPNNCPSHSLGYYIGWIRNRTTCEKLTEEDLSATLQVSLSQSYSGMRVIETRQ